MSELPVFFNSVISLAKHTDGETACIVGLARSLISFPYVRVLITYSVGFLIPD